MDAKKNDVNINITILLFYKNFALFSQLPTIKQKRSLFQ